MKRREFITALGATAVWPLAARAQQPKLWRIGFLGGGSRAVSLDVASGLAVGMRELGYVDYKDFVIEYRFAEGEYDRFPELANELLRLKVDVIVLGTPAAIRPVQQASPTIPIVMGISADPVGNGFVASLARPGGNITGLASSLDDITPKSLELLTTLLPNISSIGLLTNPAGPNHGTVLSLAQASAQQLGVSLVPVHAQNAREIEQAFAVLARKRVAALDVVPDALFSTQRQRIAELALAAHLPTIFHQREYVVAGGLMSYGERLFDFFRRAATYVDKIIKGRKPADLPVEQPTRYFLVLNLKTAKALGLDVPAKLLALADEVIE